MILNKCSFCLKENTMVVESSEWDEHTTWYARCKNGCDATKRRSTIEGAIKEWNKLMNNGELSSLKFKDCPFCESNKIEVIETSKEFYVLCHKCGAGSGLRTRKNNAIKAWNKRSDKIYY